MKCPNCAAQSGEDAAECPSCGLVFAKWRARQEKEKREAAEALTALAAPARTAPIDPWTVRGVAAAFVLAWIVLLGAYFRRHPARRRPALGADTGQFVQMRDPKTGEMRRLPIQRMAGAPVPPSASEPAPTAEPEPVSSSPPEVPASASKR